MLAITATIDNKGMRLARVFIQRATRQVVPTCYILFFQEVLKINPDWAPWHVLVARKLPVVDPSLDGPPAAAVVRQATELVQQMNQGVLVGVTLDFSASLPGGVGAFPAYGCRPAAGRRPTCVSCLPIARRWPLSPHCPVPPRARGSPPPPRHAATRPMLLRLALVAAPLLAQCAFWG